jgi:hypothetical protein
MTIFKPLSRPNYISGQLLTAEDLKDEQTYHLEKQRRHNRSLHGHGVVWGLEVVVSSPNLESAQRVIVSPGFAIDRNGDEILVPAEQQANLLSAGEDERLWVLLNYVETPADSVPVPGGSAESDQGSPTRIMESFQLCLAGSLEEDCAGPMSVRLARISRTPQGWVLDPFYQPSRLRRFDEKILWAASLLGGAVGLLVGLLLSNTKR